MKRLLLLALTLPLAACGTLDGKLENRIVFTPQCDRGFVASLYGPVGLTSEVAQSDVRALCVPPSKETRNASQ